jgi:serine/threonine protein kinase
MGEVYRARDTRLDRPVAIKVLPEAALVDPAPSDHSGSPGARSKEERRRRLEQTEGAASISRLVGMAWALAPENGGSPTSISYGTQPRL